MPARENKYKFGDITAVQNDVVGTDCDTQFEGVTIDPLMNCTCSFVGRITLAGLTSDVSPARSGIGGL